jgi:hypothetical protein
VKYVLANFYIHLECVGRNIWKRDNQTAKKIKKQARKNRKEPAVQLGLVVQSS